MITKELLEKSVAEHESFIEMVCENKYGHKKVSDVRESVINYCNITDEKQQYLLRSGKFIPAGSILSACSSDKAASFSNCYFNPIKNDSIESIFDCQKELARTFSMRGGSGVDLTVLRPSQESVNNAAQKSSGAVSFIPSFSELTKTIAQGGRRGALIITLDIRHPDALKFIWSKAKPQDVFQKDVFTGTYPTIDAANISLKLTDEFMCAADNNENWTFIFPDIQYDKAFYDSNWDGDYDKWISIGGKIKEYKTVKANDILNQIAEASHMCGDPGILFIDTVQENTFGTYIDKSLKPIGVNPCQPKWATILTPNGISTIENINIGDKIWSEDGWVNVTKKINNGKKDVYKYIPTTGVFYGTENHRIKSNGLKIEVDKAESIDNLQYDASCSSDNKQAIIDGLLIGDGSVHAASNNLIYLCIGENDKDYLDSEIKDYIIKHRPGLSACAWEVKTELDYKYLTKTYNRSIPLKYKHGNSDLVASFLKGLFSANGSVLEDHGRITLKSSSLNIIEDVQIMLSSIGIGSYYTVNKSKNVKFKNGTYTCKKSYDLNITVDSTKFKEKIGFLQNYKNKKVEKFDKILRKKFKSNFDIKEKIFVSTEDVFDITVDGTSHTYWSGGLNVSNCGEEPLAAYNNCLLGCFVLPKYLSDGSFMWTDLYDDIKTATRLMNLFSNINENKHPLIQQRDADKFGKRIGIEFTGLGDVFAFLGYKYGDTTSISFCETLSNNLLYYSIEESINIAKENGPCEALNTKEKRRKFISINSFQGDLIDSFHEDILEYGLANSAFLTIGPCGSISILSDNCTSGIEPLFKFSYKRKNRIDGKEYEFIHYPACKEMLKRFDEFEGLSLYEAKEKLCYLEADEIDWGDRILLQSTLQYYIDAGISSTINLPKNCTKETIQSIYLLAWGKSLKGITVFRDGCKEGVLSSIEKKEDSFPEIYEKELLDVETAIRHRVNWKKSKLYVNVSLDDEIPIEIFAKLPKEAGINGDGAFNPVVWQERCSNWDSICRLISMLMRYNIPLKDIIEQLDKSTYSLVDAAGILKRILSKYLINHDEGTIIEYLVCPQCEERSYISEGGCYICKECGYSKCG